MHFNTLVAIQKNAYMIRQSLVVIKEIYREVLFNHEFHQYANSIGFHPHVCEGYDPQSKGKVERCIQELNKASFTVPSSMI